MAFMDYQNVHAMLKDVVETAADQTAYRWFVDAQKLESVTWAEHYENVKKVAKSLIALGVSGHEKVVILSYTCYRWVVADFAITSIGGCTVGIYQSNLPKDVAYIVNHSDAVIVFAEDETQLAKLFEIRDEIPNVRKVVLFKGEAAENDWVISFDAFMELGNKISEADFIGRTQKPQPNDTAALVYTSGTTGLPKGGELTHDNMTFTAQSVFESVELRDERDSFLFLPLAHVFARTCVLTAVFGRGATTFARGIDTIVEDIAVARPVWFASVPRIFEKIYSKVIGGVEAKGGFALKVFNWALAVGLEAGERKLDKKEIGTLLGLKYALADKLVFAKIKAALGGRLLWCISGAAPLNEEIGKFFHAAGVLIVEGLGMTENMSFSHLNRYDNYRFGWVGQPGPGISQKIGKDGELMVKGRNVMKGYYKMPEETAQTFTPDGWLVTGDQGEIDDDGFLRITGRKKELIITAGGKNIAPSAIEGVLATSRYINQVCVIGDRRKYLSALITLDAENVKAWAKTNGISFGSMEDLVKDPQVVQLIEKDVEEKNKSFPSYETIKKITVVPEFTIENGGLTPTMKVKKSVVVDRYREEIRKMYPGQ